jgi:uncharacterized protein (TIGR00255 family)
MSRTATNRVASMTGFAAASESTPLGSVTVELKSVNSRFLDLTLRVPDDLRHLEGAFREQVSARLARGKVECRVALQRDPTAHPPRLNHTALRQLAVLAADAAAALPGAQGLSVAEALQWPGVVESPLADLEGLREPALAALAIALDGLQVAREREGESTSTLLRERCDGIVAIVDGLRGHLPAMLGVLERKLQERLSQALTPGLAGTSSLSREEINDRIRQEVTLYGLRADVDEEMKRLLTHVGEVRRLLTAGGAVGRRLDFLMQELNREANTLGSKATAIELTGAAVELKLLIEQMREQIQNLE